jgi:hypothetical protein
VAKGSLAPLTAKWGIDATIPDGSDPGEYEAIEYPFAGEVGAPLFVGYGGSPKEVAERIAAFLAEPRHFYEVLKEFGQVSQRTVVQAWSLLRQADRLRREVKTGKYQLRS